MGLHKFAAFEVLSAEIAGNRSLRRTTSKALGTPCTRINRVAHRADFDHVPRQPGYLYVRSRAISSRMNDNYDSFSADEIKKAYKTFIGKPVFVNHANANHRRARGVNVAAALHEDVNPDGSPDTWAETLMEVDAVNYPKLAQAVLAGHIDRTSMGCFVTGTLVILADGTQKPIEAVCAGDKVLTHTGGTQVVSEVMETPHDGIVYDIRFEGQRSPLLVSTEHPFWLWRQGAKIPPSITFPVWVEAWDLSVGDYLLFPSDSTWHQITSVVAQRYEGKVYNLDVDTDDSYVVADVAVHNCDVAYSICSACGNKATTPESYCEHLPRQKGSKYRRWNASKGQPEEEIIHEQCHGLSFFENSLLVEDPADPSAYSGKALGDIGIDWLGKESGQPAPVKVEALRTAASLDRTAVLDPADVSETTPEDFHAKFSAAMEGSPHIHHVTNHTPDEIRSEHMRPLLTNSGRTGALVHDHGDGRVEATGLFNHSGVKHAGVDLLKHTIANHGVNYVEAYGPKLPQLYAKAGFKTTEQYPFDRDQAAPGWDSEQFDEPDYHIMRLPGKDGKLGSWRSTSLMSIGTTQPRSQPSEPRSRPRSARIPTGTRSTLTPTGRPLWPSLASTSTTEQVDRWGSIHTSAEDDHTNQLRLYRGEGSHEQASHYPNTGPDALAGAWWTSDLASARNYARGGTVYSNDVYPHEAEQRGLPKNYVITDPAVRARKQVHIAADDEREAAASPCGKFEQDPDESKGTCKNCYWAIGAHDRKAGGPTGHGADPGTFKHGSIDRWGFIHTAGNASESVPQGATRHDPPVRVKTKRAFNSEVGWGINMHNEPSTRVKIPAGTEGSSHWAWDDKSKGGRRHWVDFGDGEETAKRFGSARALSIHEDNLEFPDGKPDAKPPAKREKCEQSGQRVPGAHSSHWTLPCPSCGVTVKQTRKGEIASHFPPAKTATKYTFDIDFAHSKDTLKTGEVVGGTHRVSVEADSHAEARLIADQMVAATGHEPTGARLIATRKLAYGEVIAPPEVDTLRDDVCPVCREHSSYSGDKCEVCGFAKPPHVFMDPDVDAAKIQDLRQDNAEDAPAQTAPPGQGDLVCPACGSEFTSAEADDAAGDPHLAPAAETIPEDEDQLPPGEPTPPQADHPDEAQYPEDADDDDDIEGREPDDENVTDDEDEELPPSKQQQQQPLPGQDDEQPIPGQPGEEEDQEPLPGQEVPGTTTEPQPEDESDSDVGYSAGQPCPVCGEGILEEQDPEEQDPEEQDDPLEDPEEEDVPQDGKDDAPPWAKKSMYQPQGLGMKPSKGILSTMAPQNRRRAPQKAPQRPQQRQAANAQAQASQAMHERPRAILHEALNRQAQIIRHQDAVIRAQAARQEAMAIRTTALEQQMQHVARVANLGEPLSAIGRKLYPRVAALLKQADELDPAQPVPEPAPQGPWETTQQALEPAGRDDVTQLGASPVADVSADATTDVGQPYGSVADEPLNLNQVDVTAPVEGTQGHRPPEETTTLVDVRVGNPDNPQPAFGWTMGPVGGGAPAPGGTPSPSVGTAASKTAAKCSNCGDGDHSECKGKGCSCGCQASKSARLDSSSRTMAAIHLARLRIQAGIDSGDDLEIAQAIQYGDMGDNDIQSEIGTLSKVIKAHQGQPARTASRRLVPRSASRQDERSAPAMGPGANLVSQGSVGFGNDVEDSALFE